MEMKIYKTLLVGGSGGTKKVEQDKNDSTFTDVHNGFLLKVIQNISKKYTHFNRR
jgi:hypothetical protein